MSLLLSDQKLGSHAQPGSSSYKFGKIQYHGMTRFFPTNDRSNQGTANWIDAQRSHMDLPVSVLLALMKNKITFCRAETYDTMLAWYEDINSLIDKTGDERNAFVTRHKRSLSTGSARSVSSDGGLEEDEADQVPFSTTQSVNQGVAQQSELPSRPSPGGRFPSDLQVDRSLQRGPSSGSSSEVGLDLATAAGGLQTAHASYPNAYDDRTPMESAYGPGNPYEYHPTNPPQPLQQQTSYYANNASATPGQSYAVSGPNHSDQNNVAPIPFETYEHSPAVQQQPQQQYPSFDQNKRVVSNYGDWIVPGAGGVAAGALGASAVHRHQQNEEQKHEEEQINATLAEAGVDARTGPNPPTQITHPASLIVSQHDNAAPVAPMALREHEADIAPVVAREAFVGVPNPVVVSTTDAMNEPRSLPPHEYESAGAPAVGHEAFVGVPNPVVVSTTGIFDAPSSAPQLPIATPALDAAEEGKVGDFEPIVSHMGVRRQNTDFSVSDLHVPGEYPKIKGQPGQT